jgi:hypothetical protein
MGWCVPWVLGFVGVVFEVEELTVGLVEKVDEFPFTVAHHGDEFDSVEYVISSVFGKHIGSFEPLLTLENR